MRRSKVSAPTTREGEGIAVRKGRSRSGVNCRLGFRGVQKKKIFITQAFVRAVI